MSRVPDLSDDFFDAWADMSARLGMDALDLARVAFAETGMYQRHPRVPQFGIWPFIESTLRRMGWQGSMLDFTAQPAIEQLPWMERYLQPYRGRLTNDGLVYVATFLPARLGAATAGGDGYVLTAAGDGTAFYEQNRILDRDGNGTITVGDLRRHLEIQDRGARWDGIRAEVEARGGRGGSLYTPAAARNGRVLLVLAALAGGAWYFYSNADGVRLRRRAERALPF